MASANGESATSRQCSECASSVTWPNVKNAKAPISAYSAQPTPNANRTRKIVRIARLRYRGGMLSHYRGARACFANASRSLYSFRHVVYIRPAAPRTFDAASRQPMTFAFTSDPS